MINVPLVFTLREMGPTKGLGSFWSGLEGVRGQAWLESGMARALSLANQRAPVGFWDPTQTYVPYLAKRS
jgi:hypothetical protein